MKYLGLLMIVICTTFIGVNEVGKMKQKVIEIRQIITMIEQIKIRLNYCVSSTNEILQQIASMSELNELCFLTRITKLYDSEPFDLLWEREVRFSGLTISTEDCNMLVSFGQTLGTTDLDGQLELCNIFDNRFKERYLYYNEHYRKHAKLSISLGFFLGLGIAIILL